MADNKSKSRCLNCKRLIYNGTYAASGSREPDYDPYDDPAGVWRHMNGYAYCGELFATPCPEITTLCGSTRFYDDFQRVNYELTMAGKIVISVGFYPHAKAEHGHGEGVGHDSKEKVALDDLHKRKIDVSNSIYVINKDGYIGQSTLSEIMHAASRKKTIRFMEPRTECLTLPDGDCVADACMHIQSQVNA